MLFALILHHRLHPTSCISTREALMCMQSCWIPAVAWSWLLPQTTELRFATTSRRGAALSVQPREDAARRTAFSQVFVYLGAGEVFSIPPIALGARLSSNRLYIPWSAQLPSRGSRDLSARRLTPSKPFSLELACHKELLYNPERGGLGSFHAILASSSLRKGTNVEWGFCLRSCSIPPLHDPKQKFSPQKQE